METDEIARQLSSVWTAFADDECKGYSPLYDAICRAVARDGDVLRLAAEAPLFGRQPNVLLAAVHFLLLGGVEAGGELASIYAGGGGAGGRPADGVGPAFCSFALRQADSIAALLASRRTNTNECGRSAVLVPALRWAASRTGSPLCLLDAGASAGLNLNLDRYRIDYGPAGAAGPSASSVVIECALEGDAPIADGAPAIVARCGVDRSPVSLQDPDEARWQLACVWPDTGRLDRTRAAIELAQQHPVVVVGGDVVDDLASVVAEHLPGDAPLCVVTTWVLAYLRGADRVRFADAVAGLSRDRAVAWISAERAGVVAGLDAPAQARADDGTMPSVLGGSVFRDGALETTTLLGTCHPHGRWLHWIAPPR